MTPITPNTRLAALLEAYPQLEEILLQLSPAYAKLRNPLLRNTIARVATLRQVAGVGGIPLADLINTLRKNAGQQEMTVSEEGPSSRPDWMEGSAPAISFDASEMLAAGGHPLNRVLSEISTLRAGERYELITPFTPAPLIDAVRKKGFLVWSEIGTDHSIHAFITAKK